MKFLALAGLFPAQYPEELGGHYYCQLGKSDHAAFRQAKRRRFSEASEAVWSLFETSLDNSNGAVYAYHILHQPESRWEVPTEVPARARFKRAGANVVTKGLQSRFDVATHTAGAYTPLLRDAHAVYAADFRDSENRLCAARLQHLEAMTDERAQLLSQYDPPSYEI